MVDPFYKMVHSIQWCQHIQYNLYDYSILVILYYNYIIELSHHLFRPTTMQTLTRGPMLAHRAWNPRASCTKRLMSTSLEAGAGRLLHGRRISATDCSVESVSTSSRELCGGQDGIMPRDLRLLSTRNANLAVRPT